MYKLVFLLAIISCYADAVILENDNKRIFNGNIATDNQFPYAVSIQQVSLSETTTRGHRCGGALVTLEHVLTTASCTYDIVNGVPVFITANQYRVFAGAALLTNDDFPERVRNIANYTIHPNHVVAPGFVHDIAIVTLATPFLNSTATPIPLPRGDFTHPDFTLCNITGWGATSLNGDTSVQLRHSSKFIYNQTICANLYNTVAAVNSVLATMVCASSYDILSVGCQGDNGNPLVCNNELVGLLFFPTNCQTTAFPDVHTRIAKYTTWIRSITGGSSTFRPGLALLRLFALVQVVLVKIQIVL